MNSTQLIDFSNEKFSKLRNFEFPHKKQELWRHTNLNQLKNVSFNFSKDLNVSNFKNFEDQIKEELKKNKANHYYLIFINGKAIEEISLFPKEIEITRSESRQTQESYFSLLSHNLATTSQSALSINIQKNVQIDRPLHLFFCKDYNNNSKIIETPNLTLTLGENSSLSLIENYITNSDGHKELSLSIPNSKIELQKGARLNHGKVVHGKKEDHFIQNQTFVLKRDSHLNSFHLNLGGNLARYEGAIEMNEENAKSFIGGISYIEGKEQSNQYLNVIHQVPNTESEQYFKGILFDESHNVFRGKVTVDKMAKPIDAKQLTRNLLMSKKAHVDMQPQLEIFADDVKCQHGASIGQISDEELFYLQSRGISKEKAQNLLSMAFIMDSFERIQDKEIKNFFIGLMHKKMEKKD